MSDLKFRVLSATAYNREAVLSYAEKQWSAVERERYIEGAALESVLKHPFMELLGDALQVIQDATNSPPESPDWAAFETILTRANALLTKGDAK